MASPYQSPGMMPQHPKPMSYGGGGGNPMQPLHAAAGWFLFVGWFNIIIGILYAITIVGILVAWLPIWLGICFKNVGESLKAGYPNNAAQLYRASNNLATAIRIIGVLCIIYIVLIGLYLCFVLLAIIIGMAGAAGAMN